MGDACWHYDAQHPWPVRRVVQPGIRPRGHFWGERFQSSILADGDEVLDSMLYVELNPVRAKLVEAPEQWEHDSSSRLPSPSFFMQHTSTINMEKQKA